MQGSTGHTDSSDISALLHKIPPVLYEGSAEQFKGFEESTKKNIFWMRGFTLFFSFLTFVIMGSVPNIEYEYLHPNTLFEVIFNIISIIIFMVEFNKN